LFVGPLHTGQMAAVVAAELAGKEAEAGGDQHPQGQEVCGVFDDATLSILVNCNRQSTAASLNGNNGFAYAGARPGLPLVPEGGQS